MSEKIVSQKFRSGEKENELEEDDGKTLKCSKKFRQLTPFIFGWDLSNLVRRVSNLLLVLGRGSHALSVCRQFVLFRLAAGQEKR